MSGPAPLLRHLLLPFVFLGGAALSRAEEPVGRVVRLVAPAEHFTASSPLGNGRLGAMLFGGTREERIVLNESGMWSGSPQEADRMDAAEALPEIRRLLLAERNTEAEALVNARFTCTGVGSARGRGANAPFGCYQVLGDLRLTFTHPEAAAAVEGYVRELDLGSAVARLRYTQGGVTYRREGFVSAPDEAFVLVLEADRPGALSFLAGVSRPERAAVRALDRRTLALSGALADGRGGENVRFAARVRVLAEGGTVEPEGTQLRVAGADRVVLLVTAATDIRTFAGRAVQDAEAAAEADLAKAEAAGVARLRERHEEDYRGYFGRAALALGPVNAEVEARPTPERLTAFAAGAPDPGLAALYFDFGRYLLISSSRPGGLPANLQGIWADGIQTPWNGDWHLNINVQMNYWLAEVGNLPELHRPLFALIESLTGPGARTARAYYGARGWVAHVITNPWGFTSPGESASWGATSSGSAWLCTHLWEHYRFSGDREFLRRHYPVLRESARFYLDILIPWGDSGWLVTAPSNSPENAFRTADGAVAHICLGATMDQQLVRALFGATAQAAEILGVDAELGAELRDKRARLAPTRIAPDGRIAEWLEDYAEVDPRHRHVSHLWGVYPGDEVSRRRTPGLAEAARRSLEVRGDEGTGSGPGWGTATGRTGSCAPTCSRRDPERETSPGREGFTRTSLEPTLRSRSTATWAGRR
jgi:alpha-L-fucosidase 2